MHFLGHNFFYFKAKRLINNLLCKKTFQKKLFSISSSLLFILSFCANKILSSIKSYWFRQACFAGILSAFCLWLSTENHAIPLKRIWCKNINLSCARLAEKLSRDEEAIPDAWKKLQCNSHNQLNHFSPVDRRLYSKYTFLCNQSC